LAQKQVKLVGRLLAGIFLAWLFGLSGLNKTVAVLCSAAPVGFNTMTSSSLGNLDTLFAASLLSASILIGFLWLPGLIYVLA